MCYDGIKNDAMIGNGEPNEMGTLWEEKNQIVAIERRGSPKEIRITDRDE